MLVSNGRFWVAGWHLGLHFSITVLEVDVMVTNLENIIVFVSSATDCF